MQRLLIRVQIEFDTGVRRGESGNGLGVLVPRLRATDQEGVTVSSVRFAEAGTEGPRSGPEVVGGIFLIARYIACWDPILVDSEAQAREGEV